jgi:hypothetical protein
MSVRVNLLPEATKARGRAAQQRFIGLGAAVLLLLVLAGVWFWAVQQRSDAEDRLADEQAETAALRSERGELTAFEDLAQQREENEELLVAALSDEVSIAGVLQDVAVVMPDDTQVDTLTVTVVPPEELDEAPAPPPQPDEEATDDDAVDDDADPDAQPQDPDDADPDAPVEPPPDPEEPEVTVETGPVGNFNMTGRTLTAHAPGVERVLISLDQVAGFGGLFLNSSTLEGLEGEEVDPEDLDAGLDEVDTEDRITSFSIDGQIGREARTNRYVDGLPEELR